MQATRQRDTDCELALRSALFRLGLRYRTNFRIPGTRRLADVVFVMAKVAVFVDGCFWHGCPKHGTWPRANAEWWRAKIDGNVARDRNTDALLRSSGWRVVRVWEHQDPNSAATRIAGIILRRTRFTLSVLTRQRR
jgi:DNA mismatch endonuclease, patch repair protein